MLRVRVDANICLARLGHRSGSRHVGRCATRSLTGQRSPTKRNEELEAKSNSLVHDEAYLGCKCLGYHSRPCHTRSRNLADVVHKPIFDHYYSASDVKVGVGIRSGRIRSEWDVSNILTVRIYGISSTSIERGDAEGFFTGHTVTERVHEACLLQNASNLKLHVPRN